MAQSAVLTGMEVVAHTAAVSRAPVSNAGGRFPLPLELRDAVALATSRARATRVHAPPPPSWVRYALHPVPTCYVPPSSEKLQEYALSHAHAVAMMKRAAEAEAQLEEVSVLYVPLHIPRILLTV